MTGMSQGKGAQSQQEQKERGENERRWGHHDGAARPGQSSPGRKQRQEKEATRSDENERRAEQSRLVPGRKLTSHLLDRAVGPGALS